VFTQNALAPVPPTTKVISFDTNPPAPDLIRAGKAQVLIGQKYFGWGSESVRLLHDIVNGKRPSNPIIDSGVDVVTAENLDQYLASWARMAEGR
jgi:ribose transport system substrate-binding protein